MQDPLQLAVDALAARYIRDVVRILLAAPLADIIEMSRRAPFMPVPVRTMRGAAPPGMRPRGRPRGSLSKRTETIERIVAYVTAHPGTVARPLCADLDLDRNRWIPAVVKAVQEGKIRRTGSQGSYRYWVATPRR